MVNQAQLNTVQQLIDASAHLSEVERQEWSSLLPFMNDKQLFELSGILQSKPEDFSDQKKSVAVKVSIAPSEQAKGSKKFIHLSTQPALEAGPEELELPAAHRPVLPSQPQQEGPILPMPAKGSSEENSVSAFINRNFAATLHRQIPVTLAQAPVVSPEPKSEGVSPAAEAISPVRAVKPFADIIPPKVVTPEAASPASPPGDASVVAPTASGQVPASVSPIVPQVVETLSVVQEQAEPGDQEEPAAALPMEEIIPPAKSLEDIRRLNVVTLRGRGALTLEGELKELCQKLGYFSVQFALEHSPLYQTYLAVGSRMLKYHHTFEEVETSLSESSRPYLTKPEFEEMSDLLQHMKTS